MDARHNWACALVQGRAGTTGRGGRGVKGRGLMGGRRGGFTLLEVALTLIIVGVGVLAMVESQTSLIRKNEYSSLSATGTYLANELRERLRRLPKHDPVTGLRMSNPDGTGNLLGWGPELYNRPSPDGAGTVAAGELNAGMYNDLDDYDGAAFGALPAAFPGPIDGFGRVITEIRADGSRETVVVQGTEDPQAVSLRGWSQRVTVTKVNPYNLSQALQRDEGPARRTPSVPALRVDQYPLRVTIEALYQGVSDIRARVIAKVEFVAP